MGVCLNREPFNQWLEWSMFLLPGVLPGVEKPYERVYAPSDWIVCPSFSGSPKKPGRTIPKITNLPIQSHCLSLDVAIPSAAIDEQQFRCTCLHDSLLHEWFLRPLLALQANRLPSKPLCQTGVKHSNKIHHGSNTYGMLPRRTSTSLPPQPIKSTTHEA